LGQMHRYPDPLGGELKRALARRHQVDAAQIVLGNGSHELLMLIAQALVPGPATAPQSVAGLREPASPVSPASDDRAACTLFSRYGFAVFAIAAASVGARPVQVDALADDHPAMPLGHDLRALAMAWDDTTRVLFLANPNNPTGTWFGRVDLERLLDTVPQSTL